MTRWVKLAALVLIVGGLLAYFHQYLHPWTPAAPYSPPIVSETGAGKIVLVPLDGRPPCRQFVIEAGKIRGYTVITPPSELQDYYSQPGDTQSDRACGFVFYFLPLSFSFPVPSAVL